MKEESQDHWIDPDLEARVVALVLGEASDFEREQLERILEERPELAAFKKRMEAVQGLLEDVAAGEAVAEDDNWELSAKRRNTVLAAIGGGTEEPSAKEDAVESFKLHKSTHGSFLKNLGKIAAVLGVVGLIGSWLLPATQSVREAARSTTSASSREQTGLGVTNTPASKRASGPDLIGGAALRGFLLAGDAERSQTVDALADSARDYKKESQSALSAIRGSLSHSTTRGPVDLDFFASALSETAGSGQEPSSEELGSVTSMGRSRLGDGRVNPNGDVVADGAGGRIAVGDKPESGYGFGGGDGGYGEHSDAGLDGDPLVDQESSAAAGADSSKVAAALEGAGRHSVWGDDSVENAPTTAPADGGWRYRDNARSPVARLAVPPPAPVALARPEVSRGHSTRAEQREAADVDEDVERPDINALRTRELPANNRLDLWMPESASAGIARQPPVEEIDGQKSKREEESSRFVRESKIVAGQIVDDTVADQTKGSALALQGTLPDIEMITTDDTVSVPDDGTVVFGGTSRNSELRKKRGATQDPNRTVAGPSSQASEGEATYDNWRQVQKTPGDLSEIAKLNTDLAKDGLPSNMGGVMSHKWTRAQAENNEVQQQHGTIATVEQRRSLGINRRAPVESLALGTYYYESESRKRGPVEQFAATAGLDETSAADEAFSTFSLHVSDVSFKLAQAALAQGEWPDAARIRIEEFVNAFDYGDPMPSQSEKVACRLEQAIHPFLQQRNVLRVSMRTAAAGRSSETPLRLTFLLDNSGSMERADRQQTVRRAFALLTQELTSVDQVTLISFARKPRLLADKISGTQLQQLVGLIERLPSEGGTNIEAALQLAFDKAREQYVENAQNRVILLTDGAVNLGDADPQSLARMIKTMRSAGIAFDAAGISAQGLNDEILEALTRNGDGRYYLLDRPEDADEGFVRQIAGALRPAAKNVKVQIEFNPRRVGRYKLLGFEKHRLKQEDFRNDKVDAAELAAAEAGVAVYQLEAKPDGEGDVGSVSVRFRDMSTGQMVEHRWPILYEADAPRVDQAAPSLRIATSAALLAATLRGGPLGETVDLKTMSQWIDDLPARDVHAKRIQQLQQMIQQARQIRGK